jgi:hypothetical protein
VSVSLELWREGPTDDSLVVIVRRTVAELANWSPERLDEAIPSEAVVCLSLSQELTKVVSFKKQGAGAFSARAEKILKAFSIARAAGRVVVAIWDADNQREPLMGRDQVNGRLAEHGLTGACAGVCVQELEAWFLADGGALKRCFGRGPETGLTSEPERVADPKAELNKMLEPVAGQAEETRGETLTRIASHIDLLILQGACPSGYGRFRSDVRTLLLPALL